MSADVNRLHKARRFASWMKAAGATADLVDVLDWVHVARLLGEDPPSPDTIALIGTLLSWQAVGSTGSCPLESQSSNSWSAPPSFLAVENERAVTTREFGRLS